MQPINWCCIDRLIWQDLTGVGFLKIRRSGVAVSVERASSQTRFEWFDLREDQVLKEVCSQIIDDGDNAPEQSIEQSNSAKAQRDEYNRNK